LRPELEKPMRSSPRLNRVFVALAVLAAAGTVTGCKIFGKKEELYTASVESRPLEVPPDLDRPAADRAMALPSSGTTTVSAATTATGAAAPIGFNASGDRDAVYARVGEVLAGTPGLTIASKAELLGTYDVSYGGSNFLVRVTRIQSGAYVSAVDARGLPPTGDAPAQVIGILKAALAP
jgi:hypothetical protein